MRQFDATQNTSDRPVEALLDVPATLLEHVDQKNVKCYFTFYNVLMGLLGTATSQD